MVYSIQLNQFLLAVPAFTVYRIKGSFKGARKKFYSIFFHRRQKMKTMRGQLKLRSERSEVT